MNVQERKPTSAQRKALKDAGIDATGVTVRRYPNVPVGAERATVAAARTKARERMHALSLKKKELIKRFLETDPDAREVVKELEEVTQRFEVVRSRLFHHRVELVRAGTLCNHIIGSGDSFNDALKKAR